MASSHRPLRASEEFFVLEAKKEQHKAAQGMFNPAVQQNLLQRQALDDLENPNANTPADLFFKHLKNEKAHSVELFENALNAAKKHLGMEVVVKETVKSDTPRFTI